MVFESPTPDSGDRVCVFKTVHVIGTDLMHAYGRWYFHTVCDTPGAAYLTLNMSGVRKTLEPVSCLLCIAEED